MIVPESWKKPELAICSSLAVNAGSVLISCVILRKSGSSPDNSLSSSATTLGMLGRSNGKANRASSFMRGSLRSGMTGLEFAWCDYEGTNENSGRLPYFRNPCNLENASPMAVPCCAGAGER